MNPYTCGLSVGSGCLTLVLTTAQQGLYSLSHPQSPENFMNGHTWFILLTFSKAIYVILIVPILSAARNNITFLLSLL